MSTNAAMKTDIIRERATAVASDLLSSSSLLFTLSTTKSMVTASDTEAASSATDHNGRVKVDGYARKNQKHFDNHKNYNKPEIKSNGGYNHEIDGNVADLHPSKPNIAYLKTSSLSVSSSSSTTMTASVESKLMQNAINNHHLNNNNVIVDSFESPPTTMELECVAGYDGGLPQHFVLEGYDSRTKKLRLNITSAFSDVPLFRIDLAGLLTIIFVSLFTDFLPPYTSSLCSARCSTLDFFVVIKFHFVRLLILFATPIAM